MGTAKFGKGLIKKSSGIFCLHDLGQMWDIIIFGIIVLNISVHVNLRTDVIIHSKVKIEGGEKES